MNKQFYFLSGLPRTGSTLLSSILSQNPNIHAEGLSLVCGLMAQFLTNNLNDFKNNWHDDILLSNKENIIKQFISLIPNFYYKDITKSVIVDKSRVWTLPENISMIKHFLVEKPKFIVLLRPVEEIVSSLVFLRRKNNWPENEIYENLLEDDSKIVMPIRGVISAKQNKSEEFLFIYYDEIVFETEKTLKKIYDFCEWSFFKHQLHSLKRPFQQNDEIYNLLGLHDVRPTIEKQKYNIFLPKTILDRCYHLNQLMGI